MELDPLTLRRLLTDAAELGAKRALIDAGLDTTVFNQKQAERFIGSSKELERWNAEGLVKRYKDGDRNSRVRYDRMQLEILAKTSNRTTYLNTNERNAK